MPALRLLAPPDPAAFLVWEREQEGRFELVDGEPVAMVGGTLAHAILVSRLESLLRASLGARGCHVFQSNVKVPVPPDYFYPDVLVTCGPIDLGADVVRAPVLLAEVLSPSTAEFDRGDKWARYRRLPSLRTFLLVAQDRVHVEVHRRSGDAWQRDVSDHLDALFEVADPPARLALRELYAGTLA